MFPAPHPTHPLGSVPRSPAGPCLQPVCPAGTRVGSPGRQASASPITWDEGSALSLPGPGSRRSVQATSAFSWCTWELAVCGGGGRGGRGGVGWGRKRGGWLEYEGESGWIDRRVESGHGADRSPAGWLELRGQGATLPRRTPCDRPGLLAGVSVGPGPAPTPLGPGSRQTL